MPKCDKKVIVTCRVVTKNNCDMTRCEKNFYIRWGGGVHFVYVVIFCLRLRWLKFPVLVCKSSRLQSLLVSKFSCSNLFFVDIFLVQICLMFKNFLVQKNMSTMLRFSKPRGERGRRAIAGGYMYTLHRRSNGGSQWHCIDRTCKGRIRVSESEKKFHPRGWTQPWPGFWGSEGVHGCGSS